MVSIRMDDLTNPVVIQLLNDHVQSMSAHSPPESMHALDVDALKQPDITFWSVWDQQELMGCGALRELDPTHGEIKSMRTAEKHLRKGVAAALMRHILQEAKHRGYGRVSLETGPMPIFAAAIKLYTSFGFHECEPFGEYCLDKFSVYMCKEIE